MLYTRVISYSCKDKLGCFEKCNTYIHVIGG